MPDAVVIGAGPNGLVAANVLADAGWQVLVLEEQDEPGGAVRTAELTEPGFRHDVFSAFYPLAAASPAIRSLRLEQHGLEWCHGPLAFAHPSLDGSCPFVSRDLEETVAALGRDGEAWRRLYETWWLRVGAGLLSALATPFPPWRAAAGLAAALGPRDAVRFGRFASLPVRRLALEEFAGDHPGRLLAGNALHADLAPEATGSGFFGWFLGSLAQQVGYPFPRGGAGELTAALVRRLEARGGSVVTGAHVTRVLVERGRAVGVRARGLGDVAAGKAVLADTGAPQLFLELLAEAHLPAGYLDDVRRFEYDTGTVKIDWALDAPVPWSAPDARRSPVIHVAEGMDELTVHASELARGLVPARPFLVLGQYAMGDPTRSPAGKETAWAYAHVPQRVRGDAGPDGIAGAWDERESEAFAARMEERVEALAPGFRNLVRARHVRAPPAFQAANRNLVGGAVNGGTAQLHQQLVFRPVPGLARPGTPVRGLYLASASAHPGGGVHGAPGANAARAALTERRAGRTAVALGAAAALAAAARASSATSR